MNPTSAHTRVLSPTVLYGLLIAALLVAETWIVRTDAFRRAPEILTIAVLADLILVPLVLARAMLVRTGRMRPVTLGAIAGGGAFAASLLIPNPPPFLSILKFLPALVELGLLVWGVIVGRSFWKELRQRNTTGDDVLVNVHEALAATPGLPVVLQAMVAETVVLWYGIRAFRKKPASGPDIFSYHENLVGILVMVFLATPAEGALMHYLLRQWSEVAAWVGTGLHVYSLVWIIAFYQAARLRPIALKEDTLLLRSSLIWTAGIPYEKIQSVELLKERPERKAKGMLDIALMADKPLRICFSEPVAVHGPLGIRREVSTILVGVERPQALLAQLETKLAQGL